MFWLPPFASTGGPALASPCQREGRQVKEIHQNRCFFTSDTLSGPTLAPREFTKGESVSHHMVIFENRDGHPGYNQFDSVEAAVRFVEDLRNNQGIEKFQIFELNEVKFELKQVYKVELKALTPGSHPGPDPAAARPAGSAGSPPSPGAAPKPDATTRPTGAPQAATPPPPASGPAPSSPPPASGPAPAAPSRPAPPSAPVGGQAPAGTPVPPADSPKEKQEQPARRGLFGR